MKIFRKRYIYFVGYRIEDIDQNGTVTRHSKGSGLIQRHARIKDLTSVREEILVESKKLKPYYNNMEINIESLNLV